MRIVITGGPSVGKTTIISMLANSGFQVVHEQATQIIKEGKILPWEDRGAFQAEVLARQLAAEAAITDTSKYVFLDRGLFDGEAYYIYDRLEIPPAFSLLDASRYDLAFLIELLPFFEVNDVRRENLEFAKALSDVLETCYTSRHVPVIRVPAMPPAERLDFVLQSLSKFFARASQPATSGKRRIHSAEPAAAHG